MAETWRCITWPQDTEERCALRPCLLP
jgi:hypothetical protein